MQSDPLYQTKLGQAYCADSLDFMRTMLGGQVDLVFTSPPYALHFKKEYGNADQEEYVKWFLPFAEQIKRVLTPHGSFVLVDCSREEPNLRQGFGIAFPVSREEQRQSQRTTIAV